MTAQPTDLKGYSFLAKEGRRRHWNTNRRGKIPTCIVVHTAEAKNLATGLSRRELRQLGKDNTAERVANYGANTNRQVSWHATVDSDSIIWGLPDSFRAWHCRNLNTISLGIELACRADVWGKSSTSPDWVEAIIGNAAEVVATWCRTWEIPGEWITRKQAERGVRGILGHADADPGRRSDPGKHFPKARFLEAVRERIAPPAPEPSPPEVAQLATVSEGQALPLTSEEITRLRVLLAKEVF